MHGSGGAGAREEFWSKTFNEMGIASFVVDSFSGRGLTSVSANQALLGRFNMILDAYRAHATLSAHPRIDRSRIVLMGFSRGGQTTLYASLKRFHQAWDPEVAFAAYIPLYASCNPTLIGDTDVSGVPIRMFHGAADDYVPVAPCRAYVERLRAAGNDARLTEFADAHHGYDNPLGGKDTGRRHQCAERACLQAEGGGAGHHHQRRNRPALQLPGPVRRAQSPHRLQRGGRTGDPGGGEGPVADRLQTELGAACWPKPNRVSRLGGSAGA